MATPAIFLDRDGIFNELVFRDGQFHSPRNWDEVRHYNLEDLKVGLNSLKALGFKIVMVTNQPDLERKIIEPSFIDDLHRFYQTECALDAIYMCPFFSNEHPLKKPNPGMLLLAQKEHALDLSKSYLVGDTGRDTLAAKRCGIRSVIWTRNYNLDIKSDFRIRCIKELVAIITGPVSIDTNRL